MKVYSLLTTVAACCWLPAATSSSSSSAAFEPARISYEDLVLGKSEQVLKALKETGIVSITGVFSSSSKNVRGHEDNKAAANELLLGALPDCADSLVASGAAQEHTYEDGVRRRTLAAAANEPLDGVHGGEDGKCDAMRPHVGPFREAVDGVTAAFTSLLSRSVDFGPLRAGGAASSYGTFEDAVGAGNYLEHFHAYERVEEGVRDSESEEDEASTIDWHTDQGLFIVFAPGRMIRNEGEEQPVSGGFYVRLPGGDEEDAGREVHFDQGDDLVVMLGDGVSRFYPDAPLRPVPHAFRMPQQEEATRRAWYGRMVLPPNDALLNVAGSEEDEKLMSFGELRSVLISGESEALALGCSSTPARQLEASSCGKGESYCWHRCMSNRANNASPGLCKIRRKKFAKCMGPNGQRWDGKTHKDGSYKPRCFGQLGGGKGGGKRRQCSKTGAKCTVKTRGRCCKKKCFKGKCL